MRCDLQANKTSPFTLLTKFHIIKGMVFPVVMYGCESWTIKAECWRIDAFELWCWRGLLRVPWTARRSNQSILKEISPEYSLEGLMLKLKFQYFSQLMQRADSLEKTLMLGNIEGGRRGWQRMSWLDDITASMDMSLSKLRAMVKDWEAWRAAVHGIPKSRSRLRDSTTKTKHRFGKLNAQAIGSTHHLSSGHWGWSGCRDKTTSLYIFLISVLILRGFSNLIARLMQAFGKFVEASQHLSLSRSQ